MKKNSLLIITLLATTSVFSQELPKSNQPFVSAIDTTDDRLKQLQKAYQSKRGLLPMAAYSHTTSRGKIYKLPIDNMPCLVPDMKQVTPMPQRVMPAVPNSPMPNPYPRQKIIPKEEPGNR
jgi:hypothetical protein